MVDTTKLQNTSQSLPNSIEPDWKAVATQKAIHDATREGDARAFYDRFTLIFFFSVVVIWASPPLTKLVQGVYRIPTVVKETAEKVDKAITPFAPKLDGTPRVGEKVAGYPVTSPYLPCKKADKTDCRKHPIRGTIGPHYGIDLGTPLGVQIYAIGEMGEKATLVCLSSSITKGGGLTAEVRHDKHPYAFQYLHLQNCNARIPSGQTRSAPVTVSSGTVIARTGNTGGSTGPHLDFRVKDASGNYIPPERFYLYWSMTGKAPKPTISR